MSIYSDVPVPGLQGFLGEQTTGETFLNKRVPFVWTFPPDRIRSDIHIDIGKPIDASTHSTNLQLKHTIPKIIFQIASYKTH